VVKIEVLKNYINGKWIDSKSSDFLDVENPATGEIIAKVPLSTKEELNDSVNAAKKAFDEWQNISPLKRIQYLFKLKQLMEENQKEIAEILTKEHGKIFEEAFLEVGRAIENVEVATGVPTFMQGNMLENVSENIDEFFIRKPLGVFCVIPPFNFPSMIPFWFLPYAVACGNAFIVKPSELVPCTLQYIFELIDKSKFPRGILTLINGDKNLAHELIKHPGVVGISSVTSTSVAKEIYKTAASYGKRVQCHAGAKNSAVIMDDANLKKSVQNIIHSVYGNSGQRCLAVSNIIVVGDRYEEVKDALIDATKKLKIGNGLDKSVDMGPVISAAAKKRIENYIEKGIHEGAKLTLDGRAIKVNENGHFLGPSIFEDVKSDMTIAQEEIFGPVLTLIRENSLESAIKKINESKYGNAAAIYTSNGKHAREFQNRIECGNIGINIGVAAPVGCFPFCGRKDSFFGDIHGQSMDAINFFTDKKVVIQRWL